jgi:hypothetical protein
MIAGGGFAMMAWRLAQERTRQQLNPWPLGRGWAELCGRGPTYEYYRICDKAANLWEFRDHEWAATVSF